MNISEKLNIQRVVGLVSSCFVEPALVEVLTHL